MAVLVGIPTGTTGDYRPRWMMCSVCGEGTVVTRQARVQYPAPLGGVEISGLPEDVDGAYHEARRAFSVGAFTACELVCRKILMHVAVDKGDKPGRRFVQYVNYLAEAGYVTPPMGPWVKLIKDHGNEATHDLPAVSAERAEGTLMFTAELLRLVYEMDHMTRRFTPAPPDTDESNADA